MNKVTGGQIKDAVMTRGVRIWKLRECSMCGTPLCYEFLYDGVRFDASCDCSKTNPQPPETRSYEDVAEALNIQTPAVRQQMWDEMLRLAVVLPT